MTKEYKLKIGDIICILGNDGNIFQLDWQSEKRGVCQLKQGNIFLTKEDALAEARYREAAHFIRESEPSNFATTAHYKHYANYQSNAVLTSEAEIVE